MNAYSIVLLSVFAALIVCYFIDRFTDHKLLLKIIQWSPALAALTALANAIASVLPSSDFAVAAVVLKAASDAAKKAEELYLIGQLPKDERNEFAQLLISKTLSEAGIAVTEQVQEIVDGCIAVVCMLMPHGVDPIVSEGETNIA